MLALALLLAFLFAEVGIRFAGSYTVDGTFFVGSQGRALSYEKFLDEIAASCTVVDPTDAMLADVGTGSLDELFESRGHYSPRANEIIGSVLARSLLQQRILGR